MSLPTAFDEELPTDWADQYLPEQKAKIVNYLEEKRRQIGAANGGLADATGFNALEELQNLDWKKVEEMGTTVVETGEKVAECGCSIQ